jgi:2-methylisocitrate lyase-like PEP mutase family enzyme
VLPNIWDAATAKLVAEAGFAAVATSSAAVAEAIGYRDQESAPVDDMFAANWRIARAVSVPVTMDVESGYGLSSDELVARLLAAGAAGCNLEDTDHRIGQMVCAEEQAGRLAAVRAAADRAGVPLVINARIDLFLRARLAGDPRPESELVGEVIERGCQYLAAGADCVFPIMVGDPATIKALVTALDGPVNVLLRPDGPSLSTLIDLGVARVSLGPGLFRATMSWLSTKLERLMGPVSGR